MVRSIPRYGASPLFAAFLLVAAVCWLAASEAFGEGGSLVLAEAEHDTPAAGTWWVGDSDSSSSRHYPSNRNGSETSLQLQWGRTSYSEYLPQGIWHPLRALSSRADLDWGGSRVDWSGFFGTTTFRYGLAAQYRKSAQGVEQWWDGALLYQKNQLEFQEAQLEGSLGWLWDYRQLSGEIMAEAIGTQEDQSRSWNPGQTPFAVERIRSAWVGLQGDVCLPLSEGVVLAAGGSWDYTPWNTMTNSLFVSNTEFRSKRGSRWQVWLGLQASGEYALGPFHFAVVVGMSQMRFDGDLVGRPIIDSSGVAGTGYWPQNTHKTYGIGMTLTWSPWS